MIDAAAVSGWMTQLSGIDGPGALSDAERIDLLTALESLKAAAAAAQARVTAAFAASQREVMSAAGVSIADQARSTGAQVALARRVSPRQGSRLLGLAQALTSELPATMAALTAGETTEWRATLVARETACLSREDRTSVDAALAARPGGIGGLGDGQVVREARRAAYRVDPASVVRRSSRAAAQRCVTLRPAPDAMTYLTAALPVAAGVAAHTALATAADAARAHGDTRTRGQLMADLLTRRLVDPAGAPEATPHDPTRWDSPPPEPVPHAGGESGHGATAGTRVEVHVVMSDTALLGEDDTPAEVVGHGPVPASVARRILRDAPEEAEVWVRRMYAAPATGRLTALESRARLFPASLRRLLVLRDEVCRTPWCGAPIRHADHVVAHADGGPTSRDNGQGLCASCNQVKESPGWRARPGPEDTVVTTSPTGHVWSSSPPARWGRPIAPGPGVGAAEPPVEPAGSAAESAGERRVRRLLLAA